MHARTRDRGHFRTNIELMIAVAIVVILLAIGIPWYLKSRAARGETCLAQVLALAGGPLPAGTACPWSGKPYGPTAACPEPKDHLDGDPRPKKGADGALRVTQSLPGWTGAPFDIEEGSLELVDAAERLTIAIRTKGVVRFAIAPLLLLFLFGVALYFIVSTVREREARLGSAASGVLFLALGLWVLAWAGGKRELTIVKRSGAVTAVESILGWTRSTETYAKCAGVVPVSASSGSRRRLFVVHEGAKTAPLGLSVPADRLDAADLLNRALLP